jgi:ATP-binding cassette subfamily B protein
MYGRGSAKVMRSYRQDPAIAQQKIRPGTIRRIMRYCRPYRVQIALFLVATSLDALITVANPLLLRDILDTAIRQGRKTGDGRLVVMLALMVGAIAMFDAFLVFVIRWYSAKLGQNLTYDLRTEVFQHVQKQPIAFFTRAQTGSLVSWLNIDVRGAQQGITNTASSLISNVLTLAAIIAVMSYLSPVISVISLILVPLFIFPAKAVGSRLQRVTGESAQVDAALGSMMTERFNVAGAMLVKLFGRPRDEAEMFSGRAAKARDLGVVTAVYGQVFIVSVTLLAAVATAVVYGYGGNLVVHGELQVGTLMALALLLNRMYSPIGQLSNVQVSVMAALVSFDRIFEVLDLRPLIEDKPGAVPLRVGGGTGGGTAPSICFERVSFHYPTAQEVSLASLESIARKVPERPDAGSPVLKDISFRAPAGKLTALVGPSGAGKTTITHLVTRLYDPSSGVVRIGGQDLTSVTLESLNKVVGVVSQEAHMFHDTLRENLLYARPDATERELMEACEAAQIWPLISVLPEGLDTVVGDRGYRLSGGEKQRLSLARLLLKAPSVVVLDEATAHLDSESEAAVQQALKTGLAGRTSLVIAHRLSTIREADQILVIAMDGSWNAAGTRNCSWARGCIRSCTRPSSPSRSAKSLVAQGGSPAQGGG